MKTRSSNKYVQSHKATKASRLFKNNEGSWLPTALNCYAFMQSHLGRSGFYNKTTITTTRARVIDTLSVNSNPLYLYIPYICIYRYSHYNGWENICMSVFVCVSSAYKNKVPFVITMQQYHRKYCKWQQLFVSACLLLCEWAQLAGDVWAVDFFFKLPVDIDLQNRDTIRWADEWHCKRLIVKKKLQILCLIKGCKKQQQQQQQHNS